MTISEWLKYSKHLLVDAGVNTARLDALVLLEDCLGRDRALLLAHPDKNLTPEQVAKLNRQLKRRARHEPLAYIRQKTEFYCREFYVDHHVLEPRPESETMIDVLKQLVASTPELQRKPLLENPDDTVGNGLTITDVGSGSGCLGITAALEIGLKRIYFHDIDPATLVIAKRNARRYKLRGQFYAVDLLAGGHPASEIILANLPYVPDNFQINTAAGHEPKVALYGGPDGLDLYRRMFAQAAALPADSRPKYILTEALPPQHEALAEIATKCGYVLNRHEDFIQLFALK